MKSLICILLLLVCLAGCTSEINAKRILIDQGYTDIQFTGYRPFSCGDEYTFQTGFKAKNAIGRQVSGTVCSGWMKGASIKFD